MRNKIIPRLNRSMLRLRRSMLRLCYVSTNIFMIFYVNAAMELILPALSFLPSLQAFQVLPTEMYSVQNGLTDQEPDFYVPFLCREAELLLLLCHHRGLKIFQ